MTKNQEKSEALAIYQVISQIPRGRVASYGDIAKMAGLPGYARYEGYLLKSVPTDTSLPWHRVVRSDGTIPQETINAIATRKVDVMIFSSGKTVSNSSLLLEKNSGKNG